MDITQRDAPDSVQTASEKGLCVFHPAQRLCSDTSITRQSPSDLNGLQIVTLRVKVWCPLCSLALVDGNDEKVRDTSIVPSQFSAQRMPMGYEQERLFSEAARKRNERLWRQEN